MRQTRTTIREAAHELFLERGYNRTSVADIAQRAGVSVQTVYNAFGSKAGVLKAAYNVALVGDDEPVPLAQRAKVHDLFEQQDPRVLLEEYAGLGMSLLLRLAPLVQMVLEGAAAGDADLCDLIETTDRERRVGTGMVIDRVVQLGGLQPGLTREAAHDVVWALNAYPLWNLLVNKCGWAPAAYADFVGHAMADALLGPVSHACEVEAQG